MKVYLRLWCMNFFIAINIRIKENRFPNESLGFQYPIIEENIQLRNKERICLYDAVHCKSQAEKNNYIKQFIELREQRASVMGEAFITYEYMVESIEGLLGMLK